MIAQVGKMDLFVYEDGLTNSITKLWYTNDFYFLKSLKMVAYIVYY
jgi:hypothetical protein